ncbi:MAG: T9SS type A sorting domain-containing protein [Candidatus Kapabacteria bacterium]|nr:T9SS type A sorting domain-containing protein [Candidatus Kapabacteria bacterium]
MATHIDVNSDGGVLVSAADGLYFTSDIDQPLTRILEGGFTSVVWTTTTNAVAGSSSGAVFTSSDRGQSWVRNERLSSTNSVVRIRADSSQVVVVHRYGVKVATLRGDTSDLIVDSNPYFEFNDALLIDSVIVGVGANIGPAHVYSNDRGSTWQSADLRTGDAKNAITKKGEQIVFVGGVGTYRFAVADSLPGANFSRDGIGRGNPITNINIFRCVTGNDSVYHCLARTSGPTVLRFSDSSKAVAGVFPTAISAGTGFTDLLVSSNSFIVVSDSFKVVTEGNVSRGSYRYVIYSSIDGGSTWRTLVAPTWDSRLQWISTSKTGEVIFTGGVTAYRFNINENTTTPIVCNNLRYVTSVVEAEQKMLAVGDKMAYSSDGGFEWKVLSIPFDASNIRRLLLSDAGRIIAVEILFVVGSGGNMNVWITDDWGNSWRKTGEFKNARKIDPFDFDVRAPGLILAAGQSNFVHYSINNGDSWSVASPPIDQNWSLHGCQWVDESTIRVTGDNEYVFRGVISKVSGISSPYQPSIPSLSIHPNPAVDEISIELPGHVITLVNIYDVQGHRMAPTTSIAGECATAYLGAIPAGSYLLVVETRDGVASAIIARR